MTFLGKRVFFITAILFFLCSSQGFATPVAYTDYNDFMNELPGTASVLDFDNYYYRTIDSGDSLEGITFSYNWGDMKMRTIFDDAFTSPVSSLGTDSYYLDYMIPTPLGFSLSFEPVNAIGMYFISPDNLWDYDLGINVEGNMAPEAWLDGDASTKTTYGYNAYFLGIIDDQNTFSRADISSWFSQRSFSYAVDDIITAKAATVPEPSAMILFGCGLLGVAFLKRKP